MQNDLLGHLLNFQDENGQTLTEDQISDNIIGVLFAAQDTTASALTWVLKYLHDNPKILEAVEVKLSCYKVCKFYTNYTSEKLGYIEL